MIKHQILGNSNSLQRIYRQADQIWHDITIQNYSHYSSQVKLTGLTVPHAGFIYSGLLGCLSIMELLASNPNLKLVTVLWFQHHPNLDYEHSLQNVIELVKLIDPKIKIRPILVDDQTQLSEIKLTDCVIISTDFAHYNYGLPANNLFQVWDNDYQFLKKQQIMSSISHPPCGSDTLRIFNEWAIRKNYQLHLRAYSNSIDREKWWLSWNRVKPFDGVTYASLFAIKLPINWTGLLMSKLLAYSHLEWVRDYFKFSNKSGLYWSPLVNMSGSAFITINDQNEQCYACFGSWEKNGSSLLNAIKKATHTVNTSSWNDHQPVNQLVLDQVLYSYFSITITLIAPIKTWFQVEHIQDVQKNRGYVYYHQTKHQVGMTYLPSVWQNLSNRNEFLSGLAEKQTLVYPNQQNWQLYGYDALSWTRHYFSDR